MKKFITSSLFALSFLMFTSPIFADDEVRNLVVDLKAKGFSQTQWQENITSDQLIFAPGDKFQVQLTVKNEGNRNQTQVVVSEALPGDVTSDVPAIFTIPQIAAGESYVKDITVTVKDKSHVAKNITVNNLRFSAKSEIGTEASDYTSFYTNNGTLGSAAVASSSAKVNLPATGASTLMLGTTLSAALGFVALKLRKLARGY